MLRAILADDQVSFASALKYTLQKSGEIEVIGCASNGQEAYELCKKYQPNIVLMDLLMPVCDGIKGTELIKGYNSEIKVLILTTFNDTDDIAEAIGKGADGYVLKEIETAELISAIKSVMNGLGIFHGNVLKKVSRMIVSDNSQACNEETLNIKLSSREIDIIKFVVHGMSNIDIAKALNYSEGTVKNMITGILGKLYLKDRTQLAVYAIKNRLV